jgi:diaminopimelate decarboxylase
MLNFRSNLGQQEIEQTLKRALSSGWIRPQDTAVIMYDLDLLHERLRHLTSVFPSSTLHGLAIKANPLLRVMEFARKAGEAMEANIGVEAASMGEVTLALQSGFRPDQVVYDSPVKTEIELKQALKAGIHLNIDNLSELERVNKLLKKISSGSTIGIRINPQVGVGTILESSVAGEYSKFGVPIGTERERLMEAFLTFPWLTGMHLHVGSQGCSLEMLVRGVGVLYDFAMELNKKRMVGGMPAISIFDIGGGLPISYVFDKPAPSMEVYYSAIMERAPELSAFRLITEFGRWVFTNAGWTVSRVEYVKHDPGVTTLMIHVGAELFIRECLNPTDWRHEYSLFDKNGIRKVGMDPTPCNIAGPLCFSGDILAKGVTLPMAEEGDYLVIHDTGGYTFSMWSHYNSRQFPRVLGHRMEQFEILRERDSLEDISMFWG